MDPIETFEHAGLTVEIVPEEVIDSFYDPRECDQLAHLAISYSGYTLGDEELPSDGFANIDCPVCKGGELPLYGPAHWRVAMGGQIVQDEPECYRCENLYTVEPTLVEWLNDREAEVAAPLFIHEHSGMTIRAGGFKIIANPEEGIEHDDVRSSGRFMGDDAGWDTSFVGFVYVTRERAFELGIPGTDFKGGGEPTTEVADLDKLRATMIEQAESEVREYAMYLEGDCGGYVVKDDAGNVLDSCWGWLGLFNNEDLRMSAKAGAEEARDEIEREKAEQELWAARGVVTVTACR